MFRFCYNELEFAHKFDKASDPHDEYYSHMHYFNELIYYISGDVDYTVETNVRHLSEGDIVLIPSGKYHFADVNSEKYYERYVLKFPNSILPAFLQKKINESQFFIPERKELGVIFSRLDGYYGKYNDDELYALFTSEITRVLIFLLHNETLSEAQSKQSSSFLQEIVNYIEQNIQSPLSLEALSERFNYSKTYISSEFKKYMRIPPMQYIKMKKIIAAHELILSGRKKNEVAELFGFEDYSTFYRTYKRVMGFCPGDVAVQK